MPPGRNESEGPCGHPEQAECRVPLESQTNSFSTSASAGQVERSAVDEANSDQPIGCGLDHVTLVNRIADHDLNGNATRTREGAAADRRLNIADDLGKRAAAALHSSPDSTRDATNIGFDLAC